jgi:hypothetical protein
MPDQERADYQRFAVHGNLYAVNAPAQGSLQGDDFE